MRESELNVREYFTFFHFDLIILIKIFLFCLELSAFQQQHSDVISRCIEEFCPYIQVQWNGSKLSLVQHGCLGLGQMAGVRLKVPAQNADIIVQVTFRGGKKLLY